MLVKLDPILSGEKRKRRKPLNKSTRIRIARGQRWKCGKCGTDISDIMFDIDHKNSNPDDNNISNLWALCLKCHRKKTIKKSKIDSKKKRDNNITIHTKWI